MFLRNTDTEGLLGKGSPLGRWKYMVGEYMSEKGAVIGGGLEQAKMECVNFERWRFFCHRYPLGRQGGIRDYRYRRTNLLTSPKSEDEQLEKRASQS